jgi:small subunit ribosomal protein S16
LAVRIRLRRVGKKKMPVYHIVTADSRAARNGKFLEIVGRYDPLQHPPRITTEDQRVFLWLKRGALPTDTVRSLFQRTGLWLQWGMRKKGADEATIAAALEKWQMAQPEKRQREEARKTRRKAVRKAKKTPAGTESAPVAASAPAPTEAKVGA